MHELNPSKKYPRKYAPGHFLRLAKRYYSLLARRRDFVANFVFADFFPGKFIRFIKSIPRHWFFPVIIGVGVSTSPARRLGMLVQSIIPMYSIFDSTLADQRDEAYQK